MEFIGLFSNQFETEIETQLFDFKIKTFISSHLCLLHIFSASSSDIHSNFTKLIPKIYIYIFFELNSIINYRYSITCIVLLHHTSVCVCTCCEFALMFS